MPNQTNSHSSRPILTHINGRLISIVLIALFELLMVGLSFDAYSPQLEDSTSWFAFLAYVGKLPEIILVVFASMLLAMWARLPEHIKSLEASLQNYPLGIPIFLQFLSFATFLIFTIIVFGNDSNANPIPGYAVVGWIISLVLLSLFWLLSIAPWQYWKSFIPQERVSITTSLLVGVLAWVIAYYSQSLWGPLGELTFYSASSLLDLLYSEITVNPELKLLGAKNFVVNIGPPCSGYEGMGLVAIFTTIYLSIYKNEFRFPQALLLFPIGLITIWAFNVIRIVTLMVIGSSISEEMAVGGFHSQAGWISFLLVTFGLLGLAHNLKFFSYQSETKQFFNNKSIGLPSALLIPFIVLTASIILSTTFSAGFIWLYPIRVIFTGIALLFCWKTYSFIVPKFNPETIIVGVFVFFVWILLTYNNYDLNLNFSSSLYSAPSIISITWLVFRCIGAVIIIPIVEELLFRGYLLARLSKQEITLNSAMIFSWKGLIFSSILFGILHSNLLAGTFAGLAYGIVRFRSASILDAVIAHGVTNLLLSLMVIYTSNWSMW